MKQNYWLALAFMVVFNYLTQSDARDQQSCDLPLVPMCNCSSDSLTAVYNISCEFYTGNVTEAILQHSDSQTINVLELDLSSNQLSAIPPNFLAGFSVITTLDLSNNSLTEIPVTLEREGLTVTKLRMEHNKITSLDISFLRELSDVCLLDVSHNQITEMIGNIPGNLTLKIHSLDISFNQLTCINQSVLYYTNVVHSLDLSHNHIKSIDLFPKMMIQHLNLSYNNLSAIPDKCFQNLPNLTQLNLSGNKIRHVQSPLFNGLHNLAMLQLSNNSISGMDPDVLVYLPNLHLLSLDHNKLTSIDSLLFSTTSNRLKTLILSFNKISVIDKYSFVNLAHLTSLLLTGNTNLRYLNVSLPIHLVVLDLANCSITELSECDFKDLVDLHFLHLQGNSLSCDCHMVWLKEWYSFAMDKDLKIHSEVHDPWRCKTDETLTPFHTYPRANFTCKEGESAQRFCPKHALKLQIDKLTDSNDLLTLEITADELNLRMNTSVNADKIIAKWSINPIHRIYGFKFQLSSSDEGVVLSPWIHSSQRLYIMNDIASYTNYNACLSAYYNETVVIATACDSVYIISNKIYIGIMAGLVAIVPCFVVLAIVIWKDRNVVKYEQLQIVKEGLTEEELTLDHEIPVPAGSQMLAVSNTAKQQITEEMTASGSNTSDTASMEIESYINRSFIMDEKSAENSIKDTKAENDDSKDSGDKNTRLSPLPIAKDIQCCDLQHEVFVTRL